MPPVFLPPAPPPPIWQMLLSLLLSLHFSCASFCIRIQWPYNLHRLCHAAFPINVELEEGVVHGVGETHLSVEVMIFLAILSIHDLLIMGKTNTNPEASGSSLRLKLNVERLIPVIQ